MKRLIALVVALAAPCASFGAAPVVDKSTSASGTVTGAGVRTPPAAADTVALRRQLADLTLEIEQLRTELREMRGQIESQTHEVESLKTRNREALADMDKRMRELERRSTPVSAGAPVTADNSSAGAPSGGEQQEYDAAFNLMKQGYYDKAGKSFREFVARHPASELSGNAQYWVGESLYVVRNFKQALDEFSRAVDKYPSSPKAADALLKVGYCQHELGNFDKARQALQQVINRYPNTANAKSAEKRLAEIKAAEAKSKAPETKAKAPETKATPVQQKGAETRKDVRR